MPLPSLRPRAGLRTTLSGAASACGRALAPPAARGAVWQQAAAGQEGTSSALLMADPQETGVAGLAAQPEMEPVLGAAEQPPRDEAPPAKSGSALPLVQPGGREQEVPRTLRDALALFFTHPSSLLILVGLSALAAARAQSPVHPAADAGVAAGVVAFWCLQEWVVHAWLLHSPFDWAGRRIHEGHHARPYFHVSIDDPPLVAAFMLMSLALFLCAFRGGELALTAALAYYAMGLAYEFTHYIAHTRYLPRSRIGKAIRMQHMLHHMRNEANWLAFILPAVDSLFGTAPDPASVRMSDMARAGLGAAREASSGGGSGGSALEKLRESRGSAVAGSKP